MPCKGTTLGSLEIRVNAEESGKRVNNLWEEQCNMMLTLLPSFSFNSSGTDLLEKVQGAHDDQDSVGGWL